MHCRRRAASRHVRIDLQERLRVAGSAPPIIVTTSKARNGHTGACATERLRRVFLEASRRLHADRHHRVDHESLARMEVRLSLRPRVLLADDYPDIVKAVSRLLAMDCEIVGSVADGSALLEAAQRLQPDVIVLDVNLPNVHSLEACREITRVNPMTKVIIFTATDPAASQAFLEAGASAFISKMAAGDLLSTIKRLCIG